MLNIILNIVKYYFIIGISITIFILVMFCGIVIFARNNPLFSKSIESFTNKTHLQKTKEIADYIFRWPLVLFVWIYTAIKAFKKGQNAAK